MHFSKIESGTDAVGGVQMVLIDFAVIFKSPEGFENRFHHKGGGDVLRRIAEADGDPADYIFDVRGGAVLVEDEARNVQNRRADYALGVDDCIAAVCAQKDVVVVQISVQENSVRVFFKQIAADGLRQRGARLPFGALAASDAEILRRIQPVQIGFALGFGQVYGAENICKCTDASFKRDFFPQDRAGQDASFEQQAACFIKGICLAAAAAVQTRKHPAF